MAEAIRCECGSVARGEFAAAVPGAAETHVAADHPDLAGQIARAMVQE